MEGFNIERIEKIDDFALLFEGGISQSVQTAYRLFSLFSENKIDIVFALQSTNPEDETDYRGAVINSRDIEKAQLFFDEIFLD